LSHQRLMKEITMKINWINFEFNLGNVGVEQKQINPLNALIGNLTHKCLRSNRDRAPEYDSSRSLGENKRFKAIKEYIKKILRKIRNLFKKTPKTPDKKVSEKLPKEQKTNNPASPPPTAPPPPPVSKTAIPVSLKHLHEELKKRVPEAEASQREGNPSSSQPSNPGKQAPSSSQLKPAPKPTNAQPAAATAQPKAAPKSSNAQPAAATAQPKAAPKSSNTQPAAATAQPKAAQPGTTTTQPKPAPRPQSAHISSKTPSTQNPMDPSVIPVVKHVFHNNVTNPAQTTPNEPSVTERRHSNIAAQWEQKVAEKAAVKNLPAKVQITATKKTPEFLKGLAATIGKGSPSSTPEKKTVVVPEEASQTAPSISELSSQVNAPPVIPSEKIKVQPQNKAPVLVSKTFSPNPIPSSLPPRTPGSAPEKGSRLSSIADNWQQKAMAPSSSEKLAAKTPPNKLPSSLGEKIAHLNFSPKGATPPKIPRNLEGKFVAAEQADAEKDKQNGGGDEKPSAEQADAKKDIHDGGMDYTPTAEEMELMTSSCPDAQFEELYDLGSQSVSKDDSFSTSQAVASPPRLASINKGRVAPSNRKRPTRKMRTLKAEKSTSSTLSTEESKTSSPDSFEKPIEAETNEQLSENLEKPVVESKGSGDELGESFVLVSPELTPVSSPREDVEEQEN